MANGCVHKQGKFIFYTQYVSAPKYVLTRLTHLQLLQNIQLPKALSIIDSTSVMLVYTIKNTQVFHKPWHKKFTTNAIPYWRYCQGHIKL